MDRSAIRHPKIYSLNYVANYESEDVQLEKFLGPYLEDYFCFKFILIFIYILNKLLCDFCVLAAVLLKI
jgi:hypothetical protein